MTTTQTTGERTRSPLTTDGSICGDLRIVPAVAILCLVCSLALCLVYYTATLDDAHITFRYARNLVNGAGLGAWNIGEPPVEGFSSLTWVLMAAASLWLGISPFIAAKVVGGASLASMILLNVRAWRLNREDSRPMITAVLTAGYLPLAWYAVSGMEAVFFAALINGLLLLPSLITRRTTRSAVATGLSVLLVLTRPEGVMLAVLINAFVFVRSSSREDRIANLLPLVATLFAYASMTGYRYIHFGELLPNTYYAKAADGGWRHLQFGLEYLEEFAKETAPLWIVSAAGLAMAVRKSSISPFLAFNGGLLAIYLCYVAKVGGDPESAFPLWRHFVHIAPIWMSVVAMLIAQLSSRKAVQATLAIGALLLSDGLIVKNYGDIVVTQPMGLLSKYGMLTTEGADLYLTWVGRFADSATVSAASLAGRWGWYIPGRNIDVLGLNSRHIAHFGSFAENGPLDSKTDMAWVVGQRPDLIDGYVSGRALREGVCPTQVRGLRSVMIRGMVANPIFRADYVFVTNAPYGEIDRALFARKDYLQTHAIAGVEAVPVTETALYATGCVSVP